MPDMAVVKSGKRPAATDARIAEPSITGSGDVEATTTGIELLKPCGPSTMTSGIR